jgi:hypothetical protein
MKSLAEGDLIIQGDRPRPELIRLDWRGRSAARRPDDVLDPYLSAVLEEARLTMAGLELHFEWMEYLNSATVAVLVQFLHRARLAGLAVRFTYRPTVRWQRLSFEALRVFEHLDAMVQVVPVTAP